MTFDERHRIRFHQWLLAHDLEPEVADAILGTMQPFDWHQLATKSDLAQLESRIDQRFELVGQRFDLVDRRFESIDQRFESIDRQFGNIDARLTGMSQEIRAVLFTLIGVIVSVLLAGGAALWS